MPRTSVGTLVAELDLDTTKFHRAVTSIRTDAANLGGDPTGLTDAFDEVAESVSNAAEQFQDLQVVYGEVATESKKTAEATQEASQGLLDMGVEASVLGVVVTKWAARTETARRSLRSLLLVLRPLTGPAGLLALGAIAWSGFNAVMGAMNERALAAAARLRELGLLGTQLDERLADLNEGFVLGHRAVEAHTQAILQERQQELELAAVQSILTTRIAEQTRGWDELQHRLDLLKEFARFGFIEGFLASFGTFALPIAKFREGLADMIDSIVSGNQYVDELAERMERIARSQVDTALQSAAEAVFNLRVEGGDAAGAMERLERIMAIMRTGLSDEGAVRLLNEFTEGITNAGEAAEEAAPLIESLRFPRGLARRNALAEDETQANVVAASLREITGPVSGRIRVALRQVLEGTRQEIVLEAIEPIKQLGEVGVEAADMVDAAWENVARTIAGMIRTTRTWEDLLRNVGSLAVNILGHLAGGGSIQSFFGFRQFGGPVYAGRPYVVGERGPELFVPRQSGDIQPDVSTVSAERSQIVINAGLNLTRSEFQTFLVRELPILKRQGLI